MMALIRTALLSPSPEKEAFKKRQKLQQDNGEETDENEAEEVSKLYTHTSVWVWRALSLPQVREEPCPAWPCQQAGGVMELRTLYWSRGGWMLPSQPCCGVHSFLGLVSISKSEEGLADAELLTWEGMDARVDGSQRSHRAHQGSRNGHPAAGQEAAAHSWRLSSGLEGAAERRVRLCCKLKLEVHLLGGG